MSEKVATFMRIPVVFVASVLALASLPGCKSPATSCKQDNKDYVGAKEMPPLKAPPELQAPDTRNALKVPPLNTPERVRAKNEPCLDIPPPFATPKAADTQKPK
ncbi:MAG TPA: hypothetical protein VGO61_01590 [Steroidobacteraceae bacterium]|jgi:uncharacterized lipoprotein|nr:hypothetical protein [Steroidobacteraceae bacterium]